ncbi:MAG: Rieske 2Fe-2S domain-containing protein [Myxococcales bacterium]|nr:Rieske 2Fe-2S domain-containing protein [Myxococcales bacterium]
MDAQARRYDISPYYEGWFQLAWSRDLKRGQLKKVRQFGTTFAMFRGDDGKVGVIDDICPHLGAHFSEGGCVRGNAVRCPYHHWSFGRDGQCVDIPYSKKIPVKAKVGGYAVEERYGMIFMYRSASGGPPKRPLPVIENFDPAQYCEPEHFDFSIRIHGQDIMENSVDGPHFWAVHGHSMPRFEFTEDAGSLRVNQQMSVDRFGTTIDFRLEFHLVEPGFHYVHFPKIPGTTAMVFSSIVPIDEEYTSHRMTFCIKKTPVPGWSNVVRRFLIWQMMKTYREDMRIWENKEYHAHPVLCDGDGSIMKLRRWFAGFLDPADGPKLARLPISSGLG